MTDYGSFRHFAVFDVIVHFLVPGLSNTFLMREFSDLSLTVTFPVLVLCSTVIFPCASSYSNTHTSAFLQCREGTRTFYTTNFSF